MTDFAKLLGRLSDANVDYILVGGVAANAYGSARVTVDIDILYSRAAANLTRLVKALEPIEPYLRGAPPGLPFEWSVETLRAGLNFTLTTTNGAIDLLGEITGGGAYEDLLKHSTSYKVFSHDVWILDLPWLIKVKRAAGRPKDLEVIAELEVLLEESR